MDDEKQATQQRRGPEEWLAEVEAAGHGTAARNALDLDTRRAEMTMMGLRLATGIARDDFVAETGAGFEAAFPTNAFDDLVAGGFLERDAKALRATATGRQRLDAVLARLLA